MLHHHSSGGQYVCYQAKDWFLTSHHGSPQQFRIQIFKKYNSTYDKIGVHGGDIVRLFHKEDEGFLSCRLNDFNARLGSNNLQNIMQLIRNAQINQYLVSIRVSNVLHENRETNSLYTL